MLKPLVIAITVGSLLSGCAAVRDSRVNPFNWFGGSQEERPAAQVEETVQSNPLIPTRRTILERRREARANVDNTTPIDQVTDLRIERVPGGAIIRATGLDATQGIFNVELVPEFEDEIPSDGVLTYTLERERRANAVGGGSTATREVVVARRVTDQQLLGVRTIRVVAATNARNVRR